MDPREAYQATVPQHAIVPPPLPPPRSRSNLPLVIGGALILGLAIGVLIGHSGSSPAPVVASVDLGHLAVTSKPVDANVLVDGRFSGVAPLERLDLEPGKHSVVIDAFGYQPYSGTLVIEARGKLNLSVLLAPLGSDGATSGSVSGTGKATRAIVPPSALAPVAAPAAPAPAAPAPEPKKTVRHSEPAPSLPRRDCDGEKSRCTNNCRSASTDCEFSCPGCSSCNTSTGWDECKRQCDTCRGSCQNNTKFCESSCETQYSNCEASQPR